MEKIIEIALTIALLASVYCLVYMAALRNNRDRPWLWGLVAVLVFFGGGGMVFLTLQAFLGAFAHRWRLPRMLSVENGRFRVVTPKEDKSVKLTDCKWYLGDPSVDQLAMFTGLRRGVVIQTPEEPFACGPQERRVTLRLALHTTR